SGWTIVEQNFRSERKEIDLVARRGDLVAFVEVKTRSSGRYGAPFEAITERKRRDIARVANDWVSRFGADRLTYRFDAIAVARSHRDVVSVQHIQGASGV